MDATCGPDSQYDPMCLSILTVSPSRRLKSPATPCTSCQTWPLSRCQVSSLGRCSMLTMCAVMCCGSLCVALPASADALEAATAGGAPVVAAACVVDTLGGVGVTWGAGA